MGWASGTNIASAIEKIIIKYVPNDKILEATEIALKALTNQDWDCIDEVDLFYFIELKESRKDNWKQYKDDGYDDEEIEHYEKVYQDISKKFNIT